MPKILAIDDEESCLEIIDFSLSSRGHEVVIAESGARAIELLSNPNHGVDLILLDMMMPGMNGAETLTKIREIESAKLLPVVFQTGSSDCDPTKMYKNNGLEYVIHKPYKRNELLEVIKNALTNLVETE